MFKTDLKWDIETILMEALNHVFFYYGFILFSIYVIACSFEKY